MYVPSGTPETSHESAFPEPIETKSVPASGRYVQWTVGVLPASVAVADKSADPPPMKAPSAGASMLSVGAARSTQKGTFAVVEWLPTTSDSEAYARYSPSGMA